MSVVELPALYVDNVALVEGGPQLVLLKSEASFMQGTWVHLDSTSSSTPTATSC